MNEKQIPDPEAIPQFSLSDYSITDRVAIVSGGSDGIGRMIAHGFADAGAKVAVVARGEEKIAKVVSEIKAKGHQAIGVPTDATSPEAVEKTVKETIAAFGRIDILMNVVGGSQGPTFKRGPLLELSKEDFNEAFNINVTSAFLFSKAAVPQMMTQKHGVIINMASIGARDYRLPEPGMSVYNMTKAAIMHLTRSMAKEWAPNIRVNCINAGHFITPRRARTELPERRARSLAEIEINRFGTPGDIAGAAVFIASDAGAFFNGSYLDLHGGT